MKKYCFRECGQTGICTAAGSGSQAQAFRQHFLKLSVSCDPEATLVGPLPVGMLHQEPTGTYTEAVITLWLAAEHSQGPLGSSSTESSTNKHQQGLLWNALYHLGPVHWRMAGTQQATLGLVS